MFREVTGKSLRLLPYGVGNTAACGAGHGGAAADVSLQLGRRRPVTPVAPSSGAAAMAGAQVKVGSQAPVQAQQHRHLHTLGLHRHMPAYMAGAQRQGAGQAHAVRPCSLSSAPLPGLARRCRLPRRSSGLTSAGDTNWHSSLVSRAESMPLYLTRSATLAARSRVSTGAHAAAVDGRPAGASTPRTQRSGTPASHNSASRLPARGCSAAGPHPPGIRRRRTACAGSRRRRRGP